MGRDVLSIAKKEMNRRHFGTAIQLLQSKEEVYEGNFEYYLTLAIACLYAGDIGTSAFYFQQARTIKLTDSRLLLGQAAIFLRRGDKKRALQYYLDVREYEPGNKTAKDAIEFIRSNGGDYDVICRWVDNGRIEQFYPPLGANPDKIIMIAAPVIACLVGVFVAFAVIPEKSNIVNGPRADLSKLELSGDEKSSAKERDLTTQSYKYIFSDKEITRRYSKALQNFQEHRDNAAQIEINYLLNSNASLSIKQKCQVLMGYLEIPDFDTINDVPTLSDVNAEPILYLDCWVSWGGRISNVITYPDGSYSCDLLVGDDDMTHFEGTVNVKFETVPSVIPDLSAKILGKVTTDGNSIYLKGRAVYQSIR